ncbi:MAG: S8 family serine peptidase [Candidatus Aenigmarchaeota archaeon]|nr:S8 family serine peptidase [Candidatus Aenigmarchaeota archaeon]
MKKFSKGRFYSMRIKKTEIDKLEKMDSVKKVWIEKEYKPLLDVAVPLVNISSFWNSGYNGSGIKVCVLDTGINKTHPALISRVINESDFTGNNNPNDYNGHGTHVAGIVASTNSTYTGIAPAAYILNARVLPGTTATAMEGMDWCVEQGAHILSMSLGAASEANDGSDALSVYADEKADLGKIVVAAAANSGPDGGDTNCRTSRDSSGSSYSLCSPGLAHKAITVGSTGSGKSSTADTISGFSSRGPTADERTKPDVTAPGQVITSANAGYLSGTLWTNKQGTSMSTPVVAGLAALMLQARNMTPEEMKALLMNTAINLGASGKDNSYGAGRVNASKIFNEINNTARASVRNESRIHNIFVSSGTEIKATLYWPENYSLHNDLNLYLLDPGGNVKASSLSVNNTDEMVNFSAPFSGNWKLLINGSNATQVYAIASSFRPSEQMYLAARNISNMTVYHQINVTGSSRLTVNLDWNSSGVDMDLYLYNTTGSLVNYSNATSTNYENVSVNGQTGIWLARVVTNASVSYSLSSNFSIGPQIMDDVPPTVAITEPLNATYPQNFTLAFTVIENLDIAVACSMTLDNSATPLGSVSSNSPVVRNFSAAHGSHNVSVSCSDSANNTGNSAVMNFTTDSIAPSITFVSPSDENNSAVGRNYTFINASITDTNVIDSCILEWSGTNQSINKIGSGNSVTCYINKTDVDGNYNYTVYANDSLGNLNSTRRTITLDTAKPSVVDLNFSGGNNNIFSPNGDGLYDSISFNITASETANFSTTYLLAENGSRAKTFIKVDDTNSILKTWNGCFIQSCATGLAPDGNYSIEITMTDRAGNVNATNLTAITLDTTPPQISFSNSTPNNTTISTNNSVIINITAGEALRSAVLEWNGTNETMTGDGTRWLTTKNYLADGNYTFRVHANDSAGNRNVTETRWLFVTVTRNISSFISSINQTLAAKNITFELLNPAGTAADSSSLKSFEKYTLRFNQSKILIETADFLVSSLNTSAVLNITSNLTAEFNISSVFNLSGGMLDSYVWIDLNNLLPAGNFTAKITFPKIYALYFYLNGTKDAPNITRVANICDENVSNKPCYNISANASALYLPSFSGGAGGNDTQAPSLNASSPSGDYSSSSVPVNYTVGDNVAVDRCWYRLNSGPNTTLADCANTTITVSEGSNIIIIYANDTSGNLNQTNITFTFTPPATTVATTTVPSGGSGGTSTVQTTTSTTTTITATTIQQKSEDNPANQFVNQTAAVDKNETAPRNESVVTGLVAGSTNLLIGGALIISAAGLATAAFVFKQIKRKKKPHYTYKKIVAKNRQLRRGRRI